MRVRDHLALSTAAALLASPWLGRRRALTLWVAGVAVDVDHYAWYCARYRRLSLREAVRRFNEVEPPPSRSARFLHQPLALLGISTLALRSRAGRALALGAIAHVALDAAHEERMNEARRRALVRDDFACRSCGARDTPLETHLWRQPAVLPSYATANLVTLCRPCHSRQHALGASARARPLGVSRPGAFA